jgi:hypothetical protein
LTVPRTLPALVAATGELSVGIALDDVAATTAIAVAPMRTSRLLNTESSTPQFALVIKRSNQSEIIYSKIRVTKVAQLYLFGYL